MKEEKTVDAEIVSEVPVDTKKAKEVKSVVVSDQAMSFKGRATDRMLIEAEQSKIDTITTRIDKLKKQIKDSQTEIALCKKRIKLYEQAESMRVKAQ